MEKILSKQWILASFAFIGLFAIGIVRNQITPVRFDDFPCFYLAARCVVQGKAPEAYPIPLFTANQHPGFASASIMRSSYASNAYAAGFENPPRFIYPPFLLLLIWPLGFFEFKTAGSLFLVFSMVCVIISAVISLNIANKFINKFLFFKWFVVCAICWSPLSWGSVRTSNTSALSGLLISIAIWGILNKHDLVAGFAIAAAMGVKFSSVPILIYLLLSGNLRLLVSAALSTLVLAILVPLTIGIDVWENFILVLPMLGMINHEGISLPSLIIRCCGDEYAGLAKSMSLIGGLLFLSPGIFFLIYAKAKNIKVDQIMILLILGLFYLDFLIFSVSTHYHYFLYIFWIVVFLFFRSSSNTSILFRLISVPILVNLLFPLIAEPYLVKIINSFLELICTTDETFRLDLLSFIKNWHMLLASFFCYILVLSDLALKFTQPKKYAGQFSGNS